MKRYLFILVCLVVSLCFGGCGNSNKVSTTSSDVDKDIVSSSETSSETTELKSSSEVKIDDAKVEDDKKPVESTKPVESKKPVESTKPVESKKPVESTKPVESKKPVESTNPVENTKPVEQNTPSAPVLTSFTQGDFTFKLPSTFIKVTESPLMFVHKNYPQIADNVVFAIGEKDPNFSSGTKEDYKQSIELSLGSNVDITEFKPITISGYPAIKIGSSLAKNGIAMESIQYVVDGNKTYYLNCTLVNGDLKDYINEIEASISIKD